MPLERVQVEPSEDNKDDSTAERVMSRRAEADEVAEKQRDTTNNGGGYSNKQSSSQYPIVEGGWPYYKDQVQSHSALQQRLSQEEQQVRRQQQQTQEDPCPPSSIQDVSTQEGANCPSPGAVHVFRTHPSSPSSNRQHVQPSPGAGVDLEASAHPTTNNTSPSPGEIEEHGAVLADVIPEFKCFCRCERYKVYWALSIFATILIVIAIFVGVYSCAGGEGSCAGSQGSGGEPSRDAISLTTPPTVMVTLAPTPRRDPAVVAAIVAYINNITLSKQVIDFPPVIQPGSSKATPEELALQWIIEDDSLELTTETPEEKFRLQQRFSLAVLYFHAVATGTNTAGWLVNRNECAWSGIECENAAVTKVALGHASMSGQIPEDVGLLTDLKVMDLKANSLSGTIPEHIGQLTSLQIINLYGNSLSGFIPTAVGSSLTGLTYFDVGGNKLLSGSIPITFRNLTNLGLLGVWGNEFTGPLFESIGQLSNLHTLWADKNKFTGTLPAEIGQWTNMREFALNNNDFSGTIPDLGLWSDLKDLRLNDNSFNGTFIMGQWTSLTRFWVHNNNLGGSLPDSIGQWTSLKDLDVSNNNFQGSIPESIENWTMLEEARFYWNSFDGTMPTGICNVTSIHTLDVDCAKVECSCCKKDNVQICI